MCTWVPQARTTAFALSIAEMVSLTVLRAVLPAVTAALGQELAHWAKTIIETSLFFVAIIFAWLIQTIISAFYSGLRGGKMFADALIQELIDRDLLDKVPFVQKPFDPDESYLDEVIGYAIAAAGFSFQVPRPLKSTQVKCDLSCASHSSSWTRKGFCPPVARLPVHSKGRWLPHPFPPIASCSIDLARLLSTRLDPTRPTGLDLTPCQLFNGFQVT